MEIEKIDPELRSLFGKIPCLPYHNRLFRKLAQSVFALRRKPDTLTGVAISEQQLGERHVRIYLPDGERSGAGILWIHGGGYVIGTPSMNDRECALYARDLKVVVVSVGYRLAPKHPFPRGHDDCFAAWEWFQENAVSLGVEPERIVIAGQSAGAGLAAGLVQRVHDHGGIQPAGQALLCPMLDDRTAVRTELDAVKHKMWNNRNNRGGWHHYLGQAPGAPDLPPYAAPARRQDLTGLPPTWIGIGDIDLFHYEDCEYARRLQEAGVLCQIDVFTGAPHSFETLVPEAPISRHCWAKNYRFLIEVLKLQGITNT